MKRYFWNGVEFEEEPNGDWVRYEDVKLLIETKKPSACTCEIEVKRYWGKEAFGESHTWICPAHGYKRR